MTMRALIVLLAVLNLGVAAWWLFRPEPAPVAAEAAPPAVARLQLTSERPDLRPAAPPQPPAPDPAPGDNAATEPATTGPAVAEAAAAERCVRLGPFADAAALDAARAALAPRALRLRAREEREGGGRGWRVYLPAAAAADRATADATAERLRAAGFSDLLVVANGTEANSIALGRFTSEARAQAHATALQAAGFAARAEALGEVRTTRWLDLALAADTDPAGLQRSVPGARSRGIDCGTLR
jgi:type IV secretory pathway VirB10-like protein